MKKYILGIISIAYFLACDTPPKPLPILGERDINTTIIDGKSVSDTTYHTVPAFNFTNQFGEAVTLATFENKIYVSDFFFTSCPTICPLVKAQMRRIYDKYKNDDRVQLISHTIDPKRDSVAKLYDYAQKLQLEGDKWLFVTGDKDELYDMAAAYFVPAAEDADAPGGYTHGGQVVLVDRQKRVRTYADGTKAESVSQLLKDIDWLLEQDFKKQ